MNVERSFKSPKPGQIILEICNFIELGVKYSINKE
jgi:hypothetical protein